LAGAISVGTLVWNETIVPYCTQACQYINNVEIRKRPQRGILSERGIWYHGTNGFYSIDQIDPRRGTLLGLTIYQTGGNFELRRIIEVTSARWTGRGWVSLDAFEHAIGADGQVRTRPIASDESVITETLGDFLEVHREPDELSYVDLRRRMRELSRKGIDPSSYLVDLHMKLSVPFAALVLACVAIPLAGRVVRHPSIAATVGVGLILGFGYWVLLALTNALGQSGVLPAVVSAWAANVIFVLLGCGLFVSLE
jgi:lipopolysaccharide export system permease protein